jgi:hypothetical protein
MSDCNFKEFSLVLGIKFSLSVAHLRANWVASCLSSSSVCDNWRSPRTVVMRELLECG